MKKLTIFGIMILFLVGMVSAITLDPINDQTVAENGTLTFTLTASDVNATAVFHTNATIGSLNSTTGVFTYSPNNFGLSSQSANKMYSVKFWVNDTGDNTSDIEPIKITVTDVNRAPTVSLPSDVSVDINETLTITATGSDVDDDNLTYTWSRPTDPSNGGGTFTENGNKLTFKNDVEGDYTIKVVASDGAKTAEDTIKVTVRERLKLGIIDFDVDVGKKSDDNICDELSNWWTCPDDGYVIDEDAKPGDNLEFKFKVQNFYTDDEDIDFDDVSVEVIIKDLDDGDDVDDESDSQKIRADKDEKFTVKLEVPQKVDEGEYDVEINVRGDEKKTGGRDGILITRTYTLNIDKDSHDLQITRFELRQETLTCSRNTEIEFEVTNYGSNDEDEVRITLENDALGIDYEESDLELDEGVDDSDFADSIRIDASNVKIGNYPIEMNVYRDDTRLEETGTVTLTVAECDTTSGSTNTGSTTTTTEEEGKENTPVEVIVADKKETGGSTTTPVTTFPVVAQVEKEGFFSSSTYVVLLVILGIVLVALIIWIIVLLSK